MNSPLYLLLVSSLLFSTVLSQDFTVKNSCGSQLWIEGRGIGNAAIPGYDYIRPVAPGQSISYTVPSAGLASTRFWGKYGCDSTGANCLTGDQLSNKNIYPQTGCPAPGCQVPVDSLFEATWGCKPGSPTCTQQPTTYFDTSQVDGFTIPYKVTFQGDTSKCDCLPSGCGITEIDASHLDMSQCPTGEDMSTNGLFSTYSKVDLRIINNGLIVGCAAPCTKFTHPAVQQGLGFFEGDAQALYYCCPTPNPLNCLISQSCLTPDECRAGPVPQSQYVQHVHSGTNGMQYAYSYDDTVGLHTCPAGIVTYTLEFCPPGSPPYPVPVSGLGAPKATVPATSAPVAATSAPVAATTAPKATVAATSAPVAATTVPKATVAATSPPVVATTAPRATVAAPATVAATSAPTSGCPAGTCILGQSCCATSTNGNLCYDSLVSTCYITQKGNKVLCPATMNACGTGCYPPSQYSCQNDSLVQL